MSTHERNKPWPIDWELREPRHDEAPAGEGWRVLHRWWQDNGQTCHDETMMSPTMIKGWLLAWTPPLRPTGAPRSYEQIERELTRLGDEIARLKQHTPIR